MIESIRLTLGEDTPNVREENKRATRIMLMILGRASIWSELNNSYGINNLPGNEQMNKWMQ